MKQILLAIALFYSACSIAQTDCDCYERLSNLADLKAYEQKHDTALQLYNEALEFYNRNSWSAYTYFKLSLFQTNANQIDSAIINLAKSIEYGMSKSYIENDVKFEKLKDHSNWLVVEKSYRKANQNFNWSAYDKLQQLRGIDQSIRRKSSLGQIADDSLYYFVDSVNFETVKEIIAEYGFLNLIEDGFKEDFMLYFLHSSMYSEKKYQEIINLMSKEIETCHTTRSSLALLHDRRLDWYYKQKQIAGTWNFPGQFNPIENLEKVDSIRFEYNLLNLADFGKMTGRELPEGYEASSYPENYFCNEK